jgi:hypothetical protein
MNYRTVLLEIPGKMIADLGKLAMEQKAEFSEFIIARFIKPLHDLIQPREVESTESFNQTGSENLVCGGNSYRMKELRALVDEGDTALAAGNVNTYAGPEDLTAKIVKRSKAQLHQNGWRFRNRLKPI